MKPTRALTGLACVISATCLLPLLATTATAAGSTPPWEPTASALGTLTFYDATGNVVTGGNSLSHLFAYAQASSADPSTPAGTLANLEFANPISGEDPGLWTSHPDESSSAANSSAPAPLGTSADPVVSVDASGADLAAAASGFTANTAAGYANVYQVRVYTTGPGGTGTGGSSYWDADVLVNPTAGTWTETYPVGGSSGKSTTTTVTVAPATSAKQGASVKITATETGSDRSHPAGTMVISDGTQTVGHGAVSAAGTFAVTTKNRLPGKHKFTATFTATAAGFNGSTSSAKSYLINPVAKTPTITGTVAVGKTVSCRESLSSGEKATYAWGAKGKKIKTGRTLKIPASAKGKKLTCTATVTVSGGKPSHATSKAKTVKAAPAKK